METKTPMQYALMPVVENYFNFSGRARRAEYWWYSLMTTVVGFVMGFVGGLIGESVGLVLIGLFYLVFLIPGIAVTIRRLHDTGRSGWWILIGIIPIIGFIVLLVFMVMDSERGPNNWGASPKYG